MGDVRSFKDLIVWQKAFRLCVQLYEATRSFPVDERFGLTAEVRKTARSVVYNIAEGHRRRSRVEFLRFLDISEGSVAELETQLLLAHALGYWDHRQASQFLASLAEVDAMLMGLIRSLRKQAPSPLDPQPLSPSAPQPLKTD